MPRLLRVLCRWLIWLVRLCLRISTIAPPAQYGRRAPPKHLPPFGARKPPWVVAHLVRLKALMPDAGCRSIALIFNRQFAATRSMRVSKSFVAYTLRRERYAILHCRRAIKRRQAKPGRRNLVWGLDMTGKQDENGSIHAIFGVIDHGTRRLLTLRGLPRANAWTLLGHLFIAIGAYGRPGAVRSDNGSVFVSLVFRMGLKLAGIRQQLSDPGCPWQNGRIERLFGTLKGKLRYWAVPDGAGLNRSLDAFSLWYNAVRPHQNLGGRTPLEQWNGVDPFARPARHVAWFSEWDGLIAGYHMRH